MNLTLGFIVGFVVNQSLLEERIRGSILEFNNLCPVSQESLA